MARGASRGTAGVVVDVNTEGLRAPAAAARVRDAVAAVMRAERVRHALVSVTLLTSRRMAAMNRKHLGHAGATDVITFGFRDPAGAVVGDVYLCLDVIAENARRFDRPKREEFLRTVVHAALHVLGYAHPDGESRTRSPMWRRQERLLRRVLSA
ncbi:MAG: rRNA maturation RNase YbeY [Gemmatimonadaceae bacterium]|nr:rRNA maturation RNase YbeY [Gemmatimonadaceae bacterium]